MTYLKKALDEKTIAVLTVQLQRVERKLDTRPLCDFCADPMPVYVYASTMMSTGERVGCWRWCACAVCSKLIDNGDWHLLTSRVQRRVKLLLPDEAPNVEVARAVGKALIMFHDTAVPI